jgi:2-amino-4-hydroxy-6-hydroxymethyldihydropteridine diphosphokinase
MPLVYLGLGTNLGDRMANLGNAIGCLGVGLQLAKVSSVYESEPVGYSQQPFFLNVVCSVFTLLSPRVLLRYVKDIEFKIGRRPSFVDGPRLIDVDILFYGRRLVQSKVLTIPHPDIADRGFVLLPLAEIAPEMVHPGNGLTIIELLSRLEKPIGVRKVSDAGMMLRGFQCLKSR